MIKRFICVGALCAASVSAAVPASQRDALVAVYNATGGSAWGNNSGWLGAPGSECTWFGVRCDPAGARVVGLKLSRNSLNGGIPAAIDGLPDLESLDLSVNSLRGAIPAELGRLQQLQSLSLRRNGLSGEIPLELFGLSRLTALDLASNLSLSGPLPPDIARLQNLVTLDLEFDGFSGPIPPELGSLTRLEALVLGANSFNGPIPPELGNLSNLEFLDLADLRLSGGFPDSFRNLKKLEELRAGAANLSGPLPPWIGDLFSLTNLSLAYNFFTGEIPSSIGDLENLERLDLAYNLLSGPIPREIGRLRNLMELDLTLHRNSGPIPPELWELESLTGLTLVGMQLTGALPPAVGNLRNLGVLDLSSNAISGSIPSELGDLSQLQTISLFGNRFSGTLPLELGRLENLNGLNVANNALRGDIPASIAALPLDRFSYNSFDFNAFAVSDPAVVRLLDEKTNGDLEATQTISPRNLRLTQVSDRNALLEWDRIRYDFHPGGYQVMARRTSGGPPVALATTGGKDITSIVIRGLAPETSHSFTVAALTFPHGAQRNVLISDESAPILTSTTARITAPADVAITTSPGGLVQIDGVNASDDSFTLTNFGDEPTTVTLAQQGAFFVLQPQTFSLPGGASQNVLVRALVQSSGSYQGTVDANGAGVGDEVILSIHLLSVLRPPGSVIAEALATRIEVAGVEGSDSIGEASFRNRGTAALEGILVSDQPWVVPDPAPIRINAGAVRALGFRVVRSRRPPDATGSLTANLSLVYVDGSAFRNDVRGGGVVTRRISGSTPGINVTKVTVVDTPKPAVALATVPGLGTGEIAFLAPGVLSRLRSYGQQVTDVSLLNAASRPISDVRLFYTPVASTQTTQAVIRPIGTAQSVSLANVVTNVYGSESGTGTLQFRSASLQSVAAVVRLVGVTPRGAVLGDVPLFRSDQAIKSGRLFLPGVMKTATVKTDLYIQETAGASASVNVMILDAGGAQIGNRTVTIAPAALAELLDVVPAAAATVVITNESASGGAIVAYARLTDESSGDTWSVADWSRVFKYELKDAVRVPLVQGRGEQVAIPLTRRRAVAPAGSSRSVTDVTLFNLLERPARVQVELLEANGRTTRREIVIDAAATVVLRDAGGAASTSTATLIVMPLQSVDADGVAVHGMIAVSARSYRTGGGTFGTAIPVLPALSGMRLGQSRRFSNLDDATAATVSGQQSGTFRTSFGFVETAGAPVTVRARVFLDEGRSLVSGVLSRDIVVPAGSQVVFESALRAIVGPGRETEFGDLHDLQLELEIVQGAGAVIPFVVITENATGDTLLRLE